MRKVLFVCEDNAAAGPMAESFLNAFGHGEFSAESAARVPEPIDPNAVRAMRELDMDLSVHKPKTFDEIPTGGYDYVIELNSNRVRPKGVPAAESAKRMRWDVRPETSKADDRLETIRLLRDALRRRTKQFVRSFDIVVDES